MLTPNEESFEHRKREHIELALDPRTQTDDLSGLDKIRLIHEALPDFNFQDVNLESRILNSNWKVPFFVSSMTAGHAEGKRLNECIVRACAEKGWAMGVGSQRRQLFDRKAESEWGFFREISTSVFLMGNIGITQVVETPVDRLAHLVDSLGARALIVHLNSLQECLQPEGTPNFKGAFDSLKKLSKELSVPVILKETGCGFSPATLQRLSGIGLAVVDVAGLGGTHWGRVEGLRSPAGHRLRIASETFAEWGITTVESVEAAMSLEMRDYTVWASGGVRTGLDAAKLLAMGAEAVGIAKPIMESALNGEDAIKRCMESFEYELKVALFCSGSRDILGLRKGKLWTR